MIILFKALNNDSVINSLFTIATYTYGPLLGLFAFGMFTKKKVHDRYVPIVAILSLVLGYFLTTYSEELFWGYKIGFELLLVNGLVMFGGLWVVSKAEEAQGGT